MKKGDINQANIDLMAWGYREARYRLKQANKTMGRQGQTIAALRGELARIREEHSKIERGELRRLERENVQLSQGYLALKEENTRLREKLAHTTEGEAR